MKFLRFTTKNGESEGTILVNVDKIHLVEESDDEGKSVLVMDENGNFGLTVLGNIAEIEKILKEHV